MYTVQDVSFPSGTETLSGQLMVPMGDGPHVAVAVIGPVAFVKEQSPLQYATRLARHGIAALIFDPSFHGASSGEPRRFESGQAKIADLSAALDFLARRPSIDASRLGLLGICQGANWAIETAVQDDRVTSLGLVAGHYLTPQTALAYLGDDATLAARNVRSQAAQDSYDKDGEVAYVPISGGKEALLTAPPVHAWYAPWDDRAPWFAHRGQWENRIPAMCEAGIWGWRIDQTFTNLKTPLAMVHADMAASGPAIPRQLFESAPAADKSLHWIEKANQLQFYEDPRVIDQAIATLAAHFSAIR